MDNNLKEKWVAALRSGKYRQGHRVLNDSVTKEYCCLGVLCEVVGIEKKQVTQQGIIYYFPPNEYERSALDGWHISTIPNNAFGITKVQKYILINMNDRHKKSFEDIAKWIEENL